jgi:toxin-antitoxin system PIN domain toxin
VTLSLDVNPLLYAIDDRSPFQEAALHAIEDLEARAEITYLFWPVAAAFVRIATNPRIYQRPLSLVSALENVQELMSRPHMRSGTEGPGFIDRLSAACTESRATGTLVSDAHIVALMRQHGVRRILTHDRDFRKFDGVRIVDPFV